MRRRLVSLGTAVCALLLALFVVPTAHAETGFHIENGRLHESNGSEFVMRGVNHPIPGSPTRRPSRWPTSNRWAPTPCASS